MLPFFTPFSNQNQMQGGNEPSPNQFPISSGAALPNQFGFNNPQFLMPAMGGFSNQNALLSSLLNQQHLIQGLQNNLLGTILRQGTMPQFNGQQQQQLNLLGALQNPNFMSLQHGGLLSGPTLGQNLNHMMGFSANGLTCSQNPMFPPNTQLAAMNSSNSNSAFLANGSTLVGQSLSSSAGLETQVNRQNLQEPILPNSVKNNQNSGRQWPQMTQGQAHGKNFSSNSKNFSSNSSEDVVSNSIKPKFNDQGKRQPSHMRFQNFHSNNSRNSWRKDIPFPRNDNKGQHYNKGKNNNFSESSNKNLTVRKRPHAIIYSESEIQQWREARKKNFPTRNKSEKKLSLSNTKKDDTDSDAELRRQQLRQVLAKQAELGFQIAEIPSSLISEPEEQIHMDVNMNDQAPFKRFDKKRGRFQRNKRNIKRMKPGNDNVPSREPVVKKRETTLLRKLLNADIRRDKSQLLQAFRFMVLNSFFKDVPHKSLVLPLFKVKDVEIDREKSCENKVNSDDAGLMGKNGNAEEIERDKYPTVVEAAESDSEGKKSEEGEVTD